MDQYDLAAKIMEMLEPLVASEGFELLDIRVFRGGGRSTVRIYLDGENGITLDQCAKTSRTLGMHLEESDIIREAYVIEVSSPGVRRPMRTLQHFQAAVDARVILKVAGEYKIKKLKGTLVAVTETELTLAEEDAVENKTRTIPMGSVREANLDPEFDARSLIQEDRRRKKDDRRQKRDAQRGGSNDERQDQTGEKHGL
jgi:ribosome maturation factor RimP